MQNNDIYDATYYENANQKSCYNNYSKESLNNPMYLNVAQAIAEVFQPARALELGCGNGITIQHLRKLGINCDGVEISKYILKHAVTDNLYHASLHNLPFDDNTFDLVFSLRVLEHIPNEIFNKSLYEISRVTKSIQFHILPIFNTYPYTGNSKEVLEIMHQDETHVQIHDYTSWIKKFEKTKWHDTNQSIIFFHDSEYLELSCCQFILSQNKNIHSDITSRLKIYNQKQLIKYHEALKNIT